MATERIAAHVRAHEQVVRLITAELAAAGDAAGQAIVDALRAGRKVLVFGNGGSATQASHLVGELIGRYLRTRRPLPAVALSADGGVLTCLGNDFGFAAVFERQVEALAQRGDVAVGLTTSGKSENVIRGLAAAKRLGAVTIALTGAAGLIGGTADHVLVVPATSTAHIQEVHLMVLHAWCGAVDEAFA